MSSLSNGWQRAKSHVQRRHMILIGTDRITEYARKNETWKWYMLGPFRARRDVDGSG